MGYPTMEVHNTNGIKVSVLKRWTKDDMEYTTTYVKFSEYFASFVLAKMWRMAPISPRHWLNGLTLSKKRVSSILIEDGKE